VLQQYQALLAVSRAISSHRDLQGLLRELAVRLHDVVRFDEVGLDLYDASSGTMQLFGLAGGPAADPPAEPTVRSYPVDEIPTGWVWKSGQPLIISCLEMESRWPRFIESMKRRMKAQSICFLPLTTARGVLGTLGFASSQGGAYQSADLEFLSHVGNQVAVAVENALAFGEVRALKDQIEREKVVLEEEIRSEHNFQEIIGQSSALRRVLREVETVAPTDATVLIRGETGTGKELIARAVHQKSFRKGRPFVKVNCAAIPTGLLESELFGHEKGAFTGAITQKIGRFELAHLGTLFLDEVGDISLELQPKLLRVLQDQEFERLGSTRTLRVNVRVMAATNRDLGRMVLEGSFRNDLYYRLHVFPVTLPPLRERREDIPQLVRHVTQRCAQRLGKRIETLSPAVMAALTDYDWPGNIRELENFLERAVILSPGPELLVPIEELRSTELGQPIANTAHATLVAAEREHILRVLEATNGVIGGPEGAAARLGMKRSTLQWKLKKLGIPRRR
jgi:formate hydrogenlyase transcriptional activator